VQTALNSANTPHTTTSKIQQKFRFVTACHKNPQAETALADDIFRQNSDTGSILVWFLRPITDADLVKTEDFMYGIIIWLSARAQSALIVTDGGTSLAFGRCTASRSNPLAVGDLIFAAGLHPNQDEFTAGLALVIPGFWPEVAQVINNQGAAIPCRLLKNRGIWRAVLSILGPITLHKPRKPAPIGRFSIK
jgi:hypothetical protein